MNKKGLSTIVVTVILVLVAIVALGLLWYALRPIIQGGSSEAGDKANCALLTLDITSAQYAAPVAPATTGTLTVVVNRGSGLANSKVTAVKFKQDTAAPTEADVTTLPTTELTSGTYVLVSGATKPAKVWLVPIIGTTTCDPIEETIVQ